MQTSKKTKQAAIDLIKQAKKDRLIPLLASKITFENNNSDHNLASWFYKVAEGKIKPSLERSLEVMAYFSDANQQINKLKQ
jgi:mRNA-degrading endonuclease YafQ of YafQ-DinJ toxin-antitoxin module